MSSDLDDLVRASLRRHAEDAPTRVDLAVVRTRTRVLARRRRIAGATGAVAAVVAVGAVALAVGSARLDSAPPPVTDVTPTADASPEPTTAPSTTSTSSPSTGPTSSPSASASSSLPPAPAVAPWTATVTDTGGSPPTIGITVRAAGRTTLVDRANAQVWIAGWTGPGRRTLVYGYSQDAAYDEIVRVATFDSTGRLVAGPYDLRLPAGGAGLVGRAFVLPDGRLVVAELVRDAGPAWHVRLLRFSVDLTQAVQKDLPSAEEVLAVTGDSAVLLQPSTSQTPARQTTVSVLGPTATRTWTVPACPYSATSGQPPMPLAALAPDGSRVALWCWAGNAPITVVPLTGTSQPSGSGVSVTPPVPGPGVGSASAVWFDSDGTLAVTLTPGAAWRWSQSSTWSWRAADPVWRAEQPVLARTYVDGYAVTAMPVGVDGGLGRAALTTGTVPELTLGTIDLISEEEAQAFAVRPST